jgi:hypothetical protein
MLEHGADTHRMLALADALEAEGRFLDAIEAFSRVNRLHRDGGVERRLVRLRHAAFAQIDRSLPPPVWPPFVPDDPPGVPDQPPALTPDELTPAVLRNGILRHGSVWVRGLVPSGRAARLRHVIDRAIEAQEAVATGMASEETATWWERFDPIRDGDARRVMVRAAQAVFMGDSPRALYEFLETATGEEGATFDWSVSPRTIDRELPGVPIWRPEFEEGDVLFFDHMCLHRTAADEGMTRVRYGIESWFFASSVYPVEGSTPIVV